MDWAAAEVVMSVGYLRLRQQATEATVVVVNLGGVFLYERG